MIAYSIEAALAAPSINRVVVSTDDEESARVAKSFGAEVVMRPSEISGDDSASETALLHTLDHLERHEQYVPALLVFLQCTSPLTAPEDVEGTIQTLLREDADCAFTVTPFHHFIWKVENGHAVGVNHDHRVRLMRQQREPEYLETGAVVVMKSDGFLKAKHRFFGKTVMHVMPSERVLEIDEPADLTLAEERMAHISYRRRARQLPTDVEGIVFDFDGVFTDNKVYVLQDGTECVRCDRGDGLGIGMLKSAGIPMLVLSKERNPVVQARCDKLGLECIQATDDKLAALRAWAGGKKMPLEHVMYVGNDLNDMECMTTVGFSACPADAHPDIRAISQLVLQHNGGDGAIRELTEMVMNYEC